ncbi:MAG: Hsp20/alpha crystallin family protein [Candidatus Saccharibacteria bacterium]
MRHWLALRSEHPVSQWINSLDRMHEDVDRWFGEFTRGFPAGDTIEKVRFGTPRIEVYEKADNVVVNAELPGVENEQLDIRVFPREVVLKAEKKKEDEFKDDQVYRSERYNGSIARTIALPGEIDPNQASASFKNGILKITLPKASEVGGGRRLTIE